MQFPTLVYRIGGPFRKPKGEPYSYRQATKDNYDELIGAGWFPSYEDAASAHEAPKQSKPQLDHDGNGYAGGSLPASQRKPRQKKEASQ